MKRTGKLIGIFMIALAFLLAARQWCFVTTPRSDADAMHAASQLATQWYRIVAEEKQQRGIGMAEQENNPFGSLIGDEYTEITTTLGSVEAKTTATNPEFAALLVRMLHDAGINEHSTIGITTSGSFPTLAIATLAAVQTIGAKAVLISSLGASSFGANQVNATWIDVEHWLRERGGLEFESALVTYGAEGDSGGGIAEEGILAMNVAAERNGVKLFIPASFEDAMQKRITLLKNARISLLVNIGGNQTSLGYCSHSTTIPNGYHTTITSCMEPGRGLIMRMSESGFPFIELLNIRDLALKNGLPLIPDGHTSTALYTTREVKKAPVALMLGMILFSLVLVRKKE